MLIDTHTHLYLDEFASDKMETLQRAFDTGVEKLIFPNVGLSTIDPMRQLHAIFPNVTYMTMGLHPTEIGEMWRSDLKRIKFEFDNHCSDYVAIGEVGIDLYWDKTFRNEQIEAFSEQVDWSIENNLPLIIHCREGLSEVLDVLVSKTEKPRAVFHSFGGTIADVKTIRQVGDFYFGINGVITFKNSRLSEALPEIGIERIMLETDAPYLAPVPYRGKRNESAYIEKTAAKVAECFNLSIDDLSRLTSENAMRLFTKIS